FVQAEDGLRGATVTGVQPCALPILDPDMNVGVDGAGLADEVGQRPAEMALLRGEAVLFVERQLFSQSACAHRVGAMVQQHFPPRSEERRVGKECRSRLSEFAGRKKV